MKKLNFKINEKDEEIELEDKEFALIITLRELRNELRISRMVK